MQQLSKQFFTEFLWSALSLVLTFLLGVFLFGWSLVKSEFGYWLPLMLLFFTITSIINFIKKVRNNDSTRFTN